MTICFQSRYTLEFNMKPTRRPAFRRVLCVPCIESCPAPLHTPWRCQLRCQVEPGTDECAPLPDSSTAT